MFFLNVIDRCAAKNDPRSFDAQLFTTFGRGVKVVHTIFGHDFRLKMTSRLLVPGLKTHVSRRMKFLLRGGLSHHRERQMIITC